MLVGPSMQYNADARSVGSPLEIMDFTPGESNEYGVYWDEE